MADIKVPGRAADVSPLILSALRLRGFARLSLDPALPPGSPRAFHVLQGCLEIVGTPVQVFARHPLWRPIGVNLSQAPYRSTGVGAIPLHMDFVNAEHPPDFVLLLCGRPDPLGGGATLLAPVEAADSLPAHLRQQLAREHYCDGRIHNLRNIGRDINPFAVIPQDGDWTLRYTGQLLRASLDAASRRAVRALDDALHTAAEVIELAAGEAVILDQHRIVHGREPLGEGQGLVEARHARLLWQCFGRKR